MAITYSSTQCSAITLQLAYTIKHSYTLNTTQQDCNSRILKCLLIRNVITMLAVREMQHSGASLTPCDRHNCHLYCNRCLGQGSDQLGLYDRLYSVIMAANNYQPHSATQH